MFRLAPAFGALLLCCLLSRCQADADRPGAGSRKPHVFEAADSGIVPPTARNAGQVLMQLQAPPDGPRDYRLLIDTTGRVAALRAARPDSLPVSGPNAAALRKLRYDPAQKGGRPVAVWTRFRLEGGGE